jgi:hypothetical protein
LQTLKRLWHALVGPLLLPLPIIRVQQQLLRRLQMLTWGVPLPRGL